LLVRREESAKIVSYGQVLDVTFAPSSSKGCYVAGIKPHATKPHLQPYSSGTHVVACNFSTSWRFYRRESKSDFRSLQLRQIAEPQQFQTGYSTKLQDPPSGQGIFIHRAQVAEKVGLLLIISLSLTYRPIPSESSLVLLRLSLVVNIEHRRL